MRVLSFLKVPDDLHDLLLAAETLFPGLVGLAGLARRLLGRLRAHAVAALGRVVAEPNDPLGKHDLVDGLLLDQDQLIVERHDLFLEGAR